MSFSSPGGGPGGGRRGGLFDACPPNSESSSLLRLYGGAGVVANVHLKVEVCKIRRQRLGKEESHHIRAEDKVARRKSLGKVLSDGDAERVRNNRHMARILGPGASKSYFEQGLYMFEPEVCHSCSFRPLLCFEEAALAVENRRRLNRRLILPRHWRSEVGCP